MKRALVISGGGSKGAFAVGILQRLRILFPTLHFDMIIGTSTGALIAPLAAAGPT
jgi:predicted acylesterase/phospholipase RssA